MNTSISKCGIDDLWDGRHFDTYGSHRLLTWHEKNDELLNDSIGVLLVSGIEV